MNAHGKTSHAASDTFVLRGLHYFILCAYIFNYVKKWMKSWSAVGWMYSFEVVFRVRQSTNESCCMITSVGRHACPVPLSLPVWVWLHTFCIHFAWDLPATDSWYQKRYLTVWFTLNYKRWYEQSHMVQM